MAESTKDANPSTGQSVQQRQNQAAEEAAATRPSRATGNHDVNPQLDNRQGVFRPLLGAPKPQHVDGPEVGDIHDEARKVIGRADKVEGARAGQKSLGVHGRGHDA